MRDVVIIADLATVDIDEIVLLDIFRVGAPGPVYGADPTSVLPAENVLPRGLTGPLVEELSSEDWTA